MAGPRTRSFVDIEPTPGDSPRESTPFLSRFSPKFSWLMLLLTISMVDLLAESIYLIPDTPPVIPPPRQPLIPDEPDKEKENPGPTPPIIPDGKGKTDPVVPKPQPPPPPPPPPPPADSRKQILVLVLDTQYFRALEGDVVHELEEFVKLLPEKTIRANFHLIDSRGDRIWDIQKSRVPQPRNVFQNNQVAEAISQAYLSRNSIVQSPAVPYTILFWASDINPDNLPDLALEAAPAWPRFFVRHGNPDMSQKLTANQGVNNLLNLQKLSALHQSLKFQTDKQGGN